MGDRESFCSPQLKRNYKERTEEKKPDMYRSCYRLEQQSLWLRPSYLPTLRLPLYLDLLINIELSPKVEPSAIFKPYCTGLFDWFVVVLHLDFLLLIQSDHNLCRGLHHLNSQWNSMNASDQATLLYIGTPCIHQIRPIRPHSSVQAHHASIRSGRSGHTPPCIPYTSHTYHV